jgi:tRNA(Ile)-lysidine synthase TilS/MesJ
MKLQRLLSLVRRAADDYNMINENDCIAVGLSGGKDSLALLYALKTMQNFYPKKYELMAVTVSLGFSGCDFSPLFDICDKLRVPFYLAETEIGRIIFDERKEKNPCSLCSKMRKGALHNEALKRGANKIALGHNKDDVIQTLFMSMFYEGRIHTFSPVSYLDRKNLFSVRPLIYVPEADAKGFVNKYGLTTVVNPCPANGYTSREETKRFIAAQRKNYPDFDEKIFTAIKKSAIEGWEKNV